VGRSLFDHLFVAGRDGAAIYDVPFPFAALRQRLLRRLGTGAAGSEALVQVLIPLGRALQRDAAAPDYFASPRIVLAVVGDPPSPPHAVGTRLKDRLYIGYQEKAESLEVISYNETAGRFEFQIVQDYAPGRTPRVVYAIRPICISCHQNGGPIFSEAPWSETNANPEAARRLAARAPLFHGIAAEQGTRSFDQAFAISSAADRANLYGAYQQIWRDGCGDDQSSQSPAAIRCRAALLTSALQSKLSGGRHFDRRSEIYRDDFAVPTRRAWARNWRPGLAIPDPRVPDRDPLAAGPNVAAESDPLRVRLPLEVWSGVGTADRERVVTGLAQLLSAADAARLDGRLSDLARDRSLPRPLLRAPCAVSRRSLEGWGERFLFRCAGQGHDGLLLNGHFYVRPDVRLAGDVSWLAIGEDARFEDLAIAAEHLGERDGHATVSFRPLDRRTQLHVRLPDGSAIETIALTWAAAVEEDTDPSAEIPDYRDNGEVVLTVVQDFAPVGAAVAGLVRQAEQGAPGVLSGAAFHGGRAMAAILGALGVGSVAGCCWDDIRFPPVALDQIAPDTGGAAGEPDPAAETRHAFASYCAVCHATAAPFPPNFLYGETGPSGNAIAQCGERISFRLAMWDWPQKGRTKSPMPPESWLRSAGWSPAQWRDGAPRAALRDHLAGLLALTGTSAGQVERRGRQAYETLKPCLAATE
jgi:mono/diheme cytochrome c family protein